MYIHHSLIAWAQFLWSRLQTTSHVVQSTCEKGCVRAEIRQHDRAREQKRKQRDTASEESKAKEKESDRLRKKQCMQGGSSGDR